MASITLRPEVRDAILEGSPWVRREDIVRIEGAPSLGDPVIVRDHHGDFLGSGLFSPRSRIPLRIMSRDPEERLDRGAIHRRIERALTLRREHLALGFGSRGGEEAYRWIHGEADELPGFFVDRLGQVAVMRITCPALLRYEADLVGAIARALPKGTVYGAGRLLAPERTGPHESPPRRAAQHPSAAPKGGELGPRLTLLRGEARELLSFSENGARIEIPLELFEVSGFSLAYRLIRHEVAEVCRGRELLEIGGAGSLCSLVALQAGASGATAIEPEPLLAASLRSRAERIGVGDRFELIAQRGPSALRALHASGRRFDCLCLLPNRALFGKTQGGATDFEPAKLGTLLRLGLRSLRDEGTLIFGGPPGHAPSSLRDPSLEELLAHATRMESRQATVIRRLGAGPDFPRLVGFREAPVVEAFTVIVRRRRRPSMGSNKSASNRPHPPTTPAE